MRYFTSDTHFSHANIIRYCDRPFKDTHHMNHTLTRIWNNTITNEDIIYFLGDFSLNKSLHKTILPKLNGYKVLIAGNHDPVFNRPNRYDEYRSYGWDEIYQSLETTIQGKKILLSHLPYAIDLGYDCRFMKDRPIDNGLPLLHGHLHCKYLKKGKLIDVGIDNNFKILSENDVVKLLNDERDFIPSRLTV